MSRSKRRVFSFQRASTFLKQLLRRVNLRRRPVAPAGRKLKPGPAPLPHKAQWLSDFYVNFAGVRHYRLYIPGSYAGRKMPLIVMLHGCKQTPDDFAAGTQMNSLAEEFGCLVAYPGQTETANGMRCWNWFSPTNQHRGRGEPSLIAGITRQIIQKYAIDPERVYVAGLSAGGSMTAIMAATYPDLYAAACVHSGLARGSAYNVPSAYSAMRNGDAAIAPEVSMTPMSLRHPHPIPMIVFHGDEDETVHPRNGDQVVKQAMLDHHLSLKPRESRGRTMAGANYTRTAYLDRHDRSMFELWVVHGSGHAWSGGSEDGSYTDPDGPDASREMLEFFLTHRHHSALSLEDIYS